MLCNGVQWCAMVCNGVQWCAMLCNGVQWCAMVCNGVQWCAMLCNGVQCYAMVCNVAQCGKLLCYAMLYQCTPCYKMHKCTNEPNVTPKLQSSKKKLIQFIKAFEDSQQPSNQNNATTCRTQHPKQRPRTARPVTPSGNVRIRTQDPPRWTFRSPSLCNRRSHSTRCANCVTKSQTRSTTKTKAKAKSPMTNCGSWRRSTGK